MKHLHHLAVIGLATLPPSQGIPWSEPTHTTIANTPSDCVGWVPEQTEAPAVPPNIELMRRDITVAPNTCGWINGDSDVPWIVEPTTGTCFYNSDLKVVNGWWTCLDYGQTVSPACVSFCSEPQPIRYCPSSSAYCVSVLFPSGYVAYGQCNPTPDLTINIALTYTGQVGLIDLPIYTGGNGVSIGTQYPSGQTIGSTSGSAAVSSQQSITTHASSASTVSIPAAGSSSTPAPTSSSTNSSSPSAASKPVGAIVGGTIGGLAVVCVTAVLIIWILRSKRRIHGTADAPPSMTPNEPQKSELAGNYQNHAHELEQPRLISELGQSQPLWQTGQTQELDAYSGIR